MNNTTSLQPLSAGGKVAQGVQALADLARRVGPGYKLPTVRELCKQMQVSRATLDSALDALEARGMLVRKHGSGLYVSDAIRMRRIGFVTQGHAVDQSTGKFYQLLMNALRMECRKREDLLTQYIFDSEHERTGRSAYLESEIANKRVDGLIAAGLNPEQSVRVQSLGVPHVSFCASYEYVPRVDPDDRATITQGVMELARRGRRRIALVYPGYARVWESVPFLEVFQEAMREVGATTQAKWLIGFDVDVALRSLEASKQFHRLWAEADRPDAMLSMNDEYTAGVLHAAEVLGVRIPQDLMVASHANAGLELFGGSEVIRIECDSSAIAAACLATLDEWLEGKAPTPVRMLPPRVRIPQL